MIPVMGSPTTEKCNGVFCTECDELSLVRDHETGELVRRGYGT